MKERVSTHNILSYLLTCSNGHVAKTVSIKLLQHRSQYRYNIVTAKIIYIING